MKSISSTLLLILLAGLTSCNGRSTKTKTIYIDSPPKIIEVPVNPIIPDPGTLKVDSVDFESGIAYLQKDNTTLPIVDAFLTLNPPAIIPVTISAGTLTSNSLAVNAGLQVTKDLSPVKNKDEATSGVVRLSGVTSGATLKGCEFNLSVGPCWVSGVNFRGEVDLASLVGLTGDLNLKVDTEVINVPYKTPIQKRWYAGANFQNISTVFQVYKGEMYFGANNASNTSFLYKTDGVTVTRLSSDLISIRNIVEYNNELYFVAISTLTTARSPKLYKTDGVNITQIASINSSDDFFDKIITTEQGLILSVRTASVMRLFLLTSNSLTRLPNIRTASDALYSAISLNGKIYFTAMGPTNSSAYLFSTDGTSINQETTFPVGPNSPMVELNGEIYFVGITGSSLVKLFKHDGTSVTQVSDMNAAAVSEGIDQLTKVGSKLYFLAQSNASFHTKLFEFDGESFKQISNINDGESDIIGRIYPGASNVYFTASTSVGHKLFKYDGVSTVRISDTAPGESDDLIYFTEFNGGIYFSATGASFSDRAAGFRITDSVDL